MRIAGFVGVLVCVVMSNAWAEAPRCSWEDGKLSYRFLANRSPKFDELLGPADSKTPGVFQVYSNVEEKSGVICVPPDKAAQAQELFQICKQEEAAYCPQPKQNAPVDAPALNPLQSTLSTVAPGTVTYSKDIAPFLNTHCVSCHQPGGIARRGNTVYDFTSYQQVRRWAATMLSDMRGLRMPHGSTWMPGKDPEDGADCGGPDRFTSPRFPTKEELETVRKWVREEPRLQVGDPAAIPCPTMLPRPDEAWKIGEPSVVLANSNENGGKGYKIPNRKPDEPNDIFVNFPVELPPDLKAQNVTRYIKSLEFKAGNGAGRSNGASFPVVHHIHVFIDDTACQEQAGTLSEDRKAFKAEREKLAKEEKGKNGADGTYWQGRRIPYPIVGSWFPGASPVVPGNNSGVELKACDKLLVQMHYTRYRDDTMDRSQVAIKFADPGEKITPIRSLTVEKTKLEPNPGITEDPPGVAEIPAKAKKFNMSLSYTFPKATKLYGVVPHQHQFGIRHRITMVCPGKPEVCVYNGKWDFDNQGAHFLSKPIDIPAGCAMKNRCTYDLTVNDGDTEAEKGGEKFMPKGAIKFGPTAEDEMCRANYYTSVGEVK